MGNTIGFNYSVDGTRKAHIIFLGSNGRWKARGGQCAGMNALPYIHCRLLTQPPKTGGQGHSLLDERRCSEHTACTLHLYRLETKRCEWLVSACKLGLQFPGKLSPVSWACARMEHVARYLGPDRVDCDWRSVKGFVQIQEGGGSDVSISLPSVVCPKVSSIWTDGRGDR